MVDTTSPRRIGLAALARAVPWDRVTMNHGSQRSTADMMPMMMVLLAGNPSGASVHAPDGGHAGAPPPLPRWPGRRGW